MENKEWPLVTVFTLVYNTGKYVVEALESVKANNYPNLQHIIIDDYSTDGESVQLVEQWITLNNYPCTFIKHQKNHGICKTLNEILELAKGKYMLGVSDDLITETRIADHVKIFEEADENVAVVFGDVIIIDNDDKISSEKCCDGAIKEFGEIPSGKIYYKLMRGNFIPAVGVTIRKISLVNVGGFDETLFFEDWDLWLRLSKKYLFLLSTKIAGYYRRYDDSTCNLNNPKNIECVMLTLSKNISDDISKKLAGSLFENHAEVYFKLNGAKPYKYFFQGFLLRWNFKMLVFLVLSILGLKYSLLIKLRVIGK